MQFARLHNLIPSESRDAVKAQSKRRALNGLAAIVVCVVMIRDLTTSESPTPEIAFQTVPLYVQTIITLISGTTDTRARPSSPSSLQLNRISGRQKNENLIKLLRWTYWTLTSLLLIAGNWPVRTARVLPANVIQIGMCFIPILSEIRYCRMCIEFRKYHRNLNALVADGHITAEKLLSIRTKRKTLDDRVGTATGAYGAEILAGIAAAAIATVFKIHRALRSADQTSGGDNTVTSAAAAAVDLSDVLHRALRLFALCKVSGDVAREADEIVTNLLNINPSADDNLENEVSFFLWEIVNSPSETRLVYGALALGPRLFVSVFSWCVGFILILLQFRWPRTTY